jgi:hypothetical protein
MTAWRIASMIAEKNKGNKKLNEMTKTAMERD